MNAPRPSAEPQRPQAGLRREGREAAVQFLFHLDFHPEDTILPDNDFWKLRSGGADPDELTPVPARPPIPPKARAFAEGLIQGVCQHREQVDELITRFARNYRLSRLAAVDRNILRLAVYEILHNYEVPPVVAINEAIELAKQFGSEESGRFVNGLLDKVRAEVRRPSRQPGPVPSGGEPVHAKREDAQAQDGSEMGPSPETETATNGGVPGGSPVPDASPAS